MTKPAVDVAAAERFWHRYCEATGCTGTFSDVTVFGDSVDLADKLIDLVVHGPKRATAGPLADYESTATPTPHVGDQWIACDGTGAPRAVLRTTEVRIGPMDSVDDRFAWDEGEGDRTRQDWLTTHRRYVRRTLGPDADDSTTFVFERFEICHAL